MDKKLTMQLIKMAADFSPKALVPPPPKERERGLNVYKVISFFGGGRCFAFSVV